MSELFFLRHDLTHSRLLIAKDDLELLLIFLLPHSKDWD